MIKTKISLNNFWTFGTSWNPCDTHDKKKKNDLAFYTGRCDVSRTLLPRLHLSRPPYVVNQLPVKEHIQ